MSYSEEFGPEQGQEELKKEYVVGEINRIKTETAKNENAQTVLNVLLKRLEGNEISLEEALETARNIFDGLNGPK